LSTTTLKIILITINFAIIEKSCDIWYDNYNNEKEVDLLNNCDIRSKAAASGVRLWQIAEELNIADCNFSRKLRKELPSEEKEKIFEIIDRFGAGG